MTGIFHWSLGLVSVQHSISKSHAIQNLAQKFLTDFMISINYSSRMGAREKIIP